MAETTDSILTFLIKMNCTITIVQQLGSQNKTLLLEITEWAFHPALKDFAKMQQNGDLTVIQNVGYANPVRSHFRSQEIWQTAPTNQEYLSQGWLGRYLDLQCNDHQPTAGINIDTIDTLALKGEEPNSITVKDPNRFNSRNAARNQRSII